MKYSALSAPTAARRQKLEDALKFQQFIRDVDDEEAWIREKYPSASSTNIGNSLTSVQNLLKKHAALRAELDGRQKRIKAVEDIAAGLVSGSHYATSDIVSRLEGMKKSWTDLSAAAAQRQSNLDDSLHAQQYLADANEAEAWMTEKEPIVANTDYGKDEDSAQALLKKHEAVESDIHSYRSTLDTLSRQSKQCKDITTHEQPTPTRSASVASTTKSVKAKYPFNATRSQEVSMKKGEVFELVNKESADWWLVKSSTALGFVPAAYVEEVSESSPMQRSVSTSSINMGAIATSRQSVLENIYQALLEKSEIRHIKLEESQQLHQLNRECDEIEAVINDREAIASQTDVGTDLENNELIQKKFDEFLKDLAANETRINTVDELANKFVQQGHSDAPVIENRRNALNKRWHNLQELAASRNRQLAAALEVHRFNRDVDETQVRFGEKDVVLSSDDFGKDVPSVEALQRKHDGTMRDLAALETKVRHLGNEADRLSKLLPENAPAIRAKLSEINASWAQLQRKAADRKVKLEGSHDYHRFLDDSRDLAMWISSMQALASSDEVANDAGGADDLIKRHNDLRTEIDAHAGAVEAFNKFGARLLQNPTITAPDEIRERLSSSEAQLASLNESFATRKKLLDQCKELQVFKRIAEQAEAWISSREGPLLSNDTGSSLDAVEALQRKHADLLKSMEAQKEKIAEVDREASRLASKGHYGAPEIEARKNAVKSR